MSTVVASGPMYRPGCWLLKTSLVFWCLTCYALGALPRNNMLMGVLRSLHCNRYNRLANACTVATATGFSCLCSASEKGVMAFTFFHFLSSQLFACIVTNSSTQPVG